MDETLRSLGITTPQYAILCELAEFPGISNADLARRCFVTPQTMNAIIITLNRSGLLERANHETHGRIQKINLTNTGEALLAKANELVVAFESRFFRPFTLEELNVLSTILAKFLNQGDLPTRAGRKISVH
ncbi:MAG: MarR family winged helix-turn-helix transcriptional regulator [Rectinemataceae bacterium]